MTSVATNAIITVDGDGHHTEVRFPWCSCSARSISIPNMIEPFYEAWQTFGRILRDPEPRSTSSRWIRAIARCSTTGECSMLVPPLTPTPARDTFKARMLSVTTS